MSSSNMEPGVYLAIEDREGIHEAHEEWLRKFREGSEPIRALGGTAHWHPDLGISGRLHKWAVKKPKGVTYWNLFGRGQSRSLQFAVVQINPPAVGKSKTRQGVFARDHKGKRWVLHRGRLHPPGLSVSPEEFDAAIKPKRVGVRFADASEETYIPVANLDQPVRILQAQMADFLGKCDAVRLRYSEGEQAGLEELRVQQRENELWPESRGTHEIPPSGGTIAERRHAYVWHALTKALAKLGIAHSNARVGRYGPDLRTLGDVRTLFEIKTEASPADVQQAVGQLLIYEELLTIKHSKVLVLPELPAKRLCKVVDRLHMQFLTYQGSGDDVMFVEEEIRKITS